MHPIYIGLLLCLGMRQIHLTVSWLYKVNTVKQNRPFLTHALCINVITIDIIVLI